MTVIEVVFTNEYKDRETGELHTQKYTIDGDQLGFIVKSELRWGQFYNYLNSVTRPEEVEA